MNNYKKIWTTRLRQLYLLPRKIELLGIKLYQKTLSLDHGYLGKIYPNTRACKFIPTCSEYGYDAVEKYGIFRGNFLALKRVLRCNPWAKAGQYDPVPEK